MRDFSNYHEINTNAKIKHDGQLQLDNALNGFESSEAIINNKVTRVLTYEKYDSEGNSRKIIGYVEDIDCGNILLIDNDYWLITTYPDDNNIYRKAIIQLCNNQLVIPSKITEDYLRDDEGNIIYDDDGRPVMDKVESDPLIIHCIVESRMVNRIDNQKIVLPEGRMLVTIPYIENENIQIDKTFKMYNQTFKIKDIDFTNVINGKGIIVLSADKVVTE